MICTREAEISRMLWNKRDNEKMEVCELKINVLNDPLVWLRIYKSGTGPSDPVSRWDTDTRSPVGGR